MVYRRAHPLPRLVDGTWERNSFRFFSELIQALDNRFCVVAFDFPGCGKSKAWPAVEYTLSNLKELIVHMGNQINISYALGYSIGGNLLAEALPQLTQLHKIALLGSAPVDHANQIPTACHLTEEVQLLFQGWLTRKDCERLYRALIQYHEQEMREDVLRSFETTDPRFRIGMKQLISEFGHQVKNLQQFNGQVALFHADCDAAIRKEYLQSLPLPNLWQKQIQIVQQSGHLMILDQPEQIGKRLQLFFTP